MKKIIISLLAIFSIINTASADVFCRGYVTQVFTNGENNLFIFYDKVNGTNKQGSILFSISPNENMSDYQRERLYRKFDLFYTTAMTSYSTNTQVRLRLTKGCADQWTVAANQGRHLVSIGSVND